MAPDLKRVGFWIWTLALAAAPWFYGGSGPLVAPVVAGCVALGAALLVLAQDSWDSTDVALLGLGLLPWVQLLAGTTLSPEGTWQAGLLFTPVVWSVVALRHVVVAGGDGGRLVAALALLSVAEAVMGLVQHAVAPASIYGQRTAWVTSPFGSFVNHNHFAVLAGAGVLVLIGLGRQEWRRRSEATPRLVLLFGAAVLVFIAHLAAQSRGASLALAAGLVAFGMLALRGRQRFVAIAAIAAVVVSMVALLPQSRARLASLLEGSDGSLRYRRQVALDVVRLARDRPVAGVGLGSFADALPRFKTAHGDVQTRHAETDVLQFASEAGLVGAAGLLAVAFLAFRRARDASARGPQRHWVAGCAAAAVVIGAHAVIDFSLHLMGVALFMAACLAVATAAPPAVAGLGAPRAWSRAVALALLVLMLGNVWIAASVAWVSSAAGLPPQQRVGVLTHVIRFNPFFSEAYRLRAHALVALGGDTLLASRLAAAAVDYERALALRPGWAEVWYELAWVRWRRGEHVAARAALARAGELDPVRWDLVFARARLAAQLDGRERGIAVLQEARRRFPDLPAGAAQIESLR